MPDPYANFSHSDTSGAYENFGQVGPSMEQALKLGEDTQGNSLMNTEEGNFLTKALDEISRPNFAVANSALEIARGNISMDKLTRMDFGEINKLSDSFIEGLSMEKKTSFVDVMEELFPGSHPGTKIGFGLAGDIILDPINLIPVGATTKLFQLMKFPEMLKIAGELPGIERVMGAVKPSWPLRNTPGAYKKYRDLQLKLAFIRRNIRTQFETRWDSFRQVSKSLGLDPHEEAAKLINLREKGLPEEVLPEFQEFYSSITQKLDTMGREDKAAGTIKNFRENYFPHIYETGKVDELGGTLQVTKPGGFRTKLAFRTDSPFYSKARKFETLEDANKYLNGLRKDGIDLDMAPVQNWFRGYALRDFVAQSSRTWKQFTTESLEKFGVPFNKLITEQLGMTPEMAQSVIEEGGELANKIKLREGDTLVVNVANLRSPRTKDFVLKEYKEALKRPAEDVADDLDRLFQESGADGLVQISYEDLAKFAPEDLSNVYAFPAEFAKEIKTAFRVFSQDEYTQGLMNASQTVMHAWKSMATSLNVPFHARNAVSNLWQTYLGDLSPAKMPLRMKQSMQVQLGTLKDFNGFDAQELKTLADRYGVRAFGWLGADFPKMFQKELHIGQMSSKAGRLGGVGSDPWNIAATATRASRKMGTHVEDNSRIALMLNEMKKRGVTSKLSEEQLHREMMGVADHVKKYMFDYTELTPLEKKIKGAGLGVGLIPGMPFYTWMRKNIPLQMESLITKPWKFARLADVERDLMPDSAKPPAEKMIFPDWMKKEGYKRLPSRFSLSDGTPIYYNIDLPPDDLAKMWYLRTWWGSLSPAYTMLSIAQNVRTWPKGDKLSRPGQLAAAPFYVAWAPQWMKEMAGVRLMKDRKGNLNWGMDPQWKYALQTAFPMMQRWDKMHPGALKPVTLEAGKLQGEASKWQKLSYATGISFRPLDVKKEMLNLHYRGIEGKKGLRQAMKQAPRGPSEAIKILKEYLFQ